MFFLATFGLTFVLFSARSFIWFDLRFDLGLFCVGPLLRIRLFRPNPPFRSLSLELVQIDVGFVSRKVDVINLVFLSESIAFYLASHLSSCRGERDRYLEVFFLRDCFFFVKSSNANLFSAVFRHAHFPVDLPSPTTVLVASHRDRSGKMSGSIRISAALKIK